MRRILPYIALALAVAQLLLMLGSWLYSAAFPSSGIHSLLSGEGLRWFLGRYAAMLASPLMVWIVLLSMAVGTLRSSGLLRLTGSDRQRPGYREVRALWLSLAFLVVYVGAVLLLSVTPHAVLLSAVGTLWPSPFSASLVPVIAFGLMVFASLYGIIAGTFPTLASVYESLLQGIRIAAPLLLFYVLLTQFYYSVLFVIP